MKVLDYTARPTTKRKARRDRPNGLVMQVNLGVTEELFKRIEEKAKSNFRTISQEINFRIKRDLDRDDP